MHSKDKTAIRARKTICAKIQQCFVLPYKGEPDIKLYHQKTITLSEMFGSPAWLQYMEVVTKSVKRISDSFGNPLPLENPQQVCDYNVKVGQTSLVNEIKRRAKDIIQLRTDIETYLSNYPLE